MSNNWEIVREIDAGYVVVVRGKENPSAMRVYFIQSANTVSEAESFARSQFYMDFEQLCECVKSFAVKVSNLRVEAIKAIQDTERLELQSSHTVKGISHE